MRKRQPAALAGAILIITMFFAPVPAAAHGEKPRLEISPESLQPGTVLEIRGVGFEFEEQIALSLGVGPSEIPLGAAVGNAEGIFVMLATVPTDLAEGTYVVHASTDDHEVDSPQFTVRGPAIVPEEGEMPRDEDDVLLAPMPTYAPGISSTPLPGVQAQSETQVERTILFIILGALAAGGILMVAGLRGKRAG